jgi:hypothetical protein
MSVLSSLALLIAAAVKPKFGNNNVVAKLEARIAELKDDVARANVQARRDQELIDLWRERALEWRQQQQAQMLQAQAYQQQQALHYGLAQYNAQQAMNAQNFYAQAPFGQAQLGQALGLIGTQSLNAELWCNCVPSRSQVWATSAPE